jgi:Fe-S-cluster-containing hydrogenase component 2
MNHFIISDSRKCIGCKACEVACVMAHNDEQHVLTPQRFLPRITVMKHEQKRNAITCRHCESAPCARSCPNDAIRQINDSVQVDEEKCIGCKSCMVACPFGVMEIVLLPAAAGKVKATAHKCDLCSGREGGPLRAKLPGAGAAAGDGSDPFRDGQTATPAYGADGCAAVACASRRYGITGS